MKEFKCSYLGLNNRWKHIARTEDLLLDTVALHLRDVHGMSLSQEMPAKTRNSFTWPSAADAAAATAFVLQAYNCDRDPACTWRYLAQTEDLILGDTETPVRKKLGVKFTPEMANKAAIHRRHEKKHAG
jgi:predicted small metal-binding protein